MSNLISPADLAARLADPMVRVLDASWYLPTMKRDASAEFQAAHIPGACRFDIDRASDQTSPYPHTIPKADDFARYVGALGIQEETTVIVYDGAGLFSAARAWWLFKVFGHERVYVLDGGLPRWTAEGFPVAAGDAAPPTPALFTARLRPELVASADDVAAALAGSGAQVIDVRAADRFRGEAPEPRPGVRAGHMPGARNVPFTALLKNGALARPEKIQTALAEAGLDPTQPFITSCGSGVTAAILTLALDESGFGLHRLYDGSWAEWGSSERPIATGE